MPVDENGVYTPETIDQINSDLQEQLIAAGLDDLNIFDNSNYIQTTNPIVTKIYNLQVNIASFPDQIQKIFSAQNIEIARAGINTSDSILNALLSDEDIEKADVRNFTAGEVTIYVWSSKADLAVKDYTSLTETIVPNTSVWGIFIDDGGAPFSTSFRPSSQQQTTVYYNIAKEVHIEISDPLNKLTVTIKTLNPIDTGIETDKVNSIISDTISDFGIGQPLEESFIANKIFQSSSNYISVDVIFSATTAIAADSLYIYDNSEIVFI